MRLQRLHINRSLVVGRGRATGWHETCQTVVYAGAGLPVCLSSSAATCYRNRYVTTLWPVILGVSGCLCALFCTPPVGL